MRRALVAPSIAAVAALACGVITLPPDPTAPVNTCTDDPSCGTAFPEAGAGSCVGSACSTKAFAPIVVVSVPNDQPNIGGMTIPLPTNYAIVRAQIAQKGGLPLASATCLNAQQGTPATECDPIPPLATFGGGTLKVIVGFDAVLVPPGGLRPNNKKNIGQDTALPVEVTVETLWRDPATNLYAPARKLGIPLDDVAGTINTNTQLAGPTNGPAIVLGYEFGAKAIQPIAPNAPNDSMTAYRFYLVPPSPYVTVPPFTIPLAIAPGTQPFLSAITQPGLASIGQSLSGASVVYDTPVLDGGASTMQSHTYLVNEAAGAPSLEGWSLHIDDQNGHRVSGVVTLPAGASKTVTVYEATGTQAQADLVAGPDRYTETLFIDPPPGVDLPRYFAEPQASGIVGPFTYPQLPPPVELEGFVQTSDTHQQATAQVMFVANGNANTILQADLTNNAPLLLQKTTATNSSGQYDIKGLYPGLLRVYVVPDDPDLALTVSDKPIGATTTQTGATLFVNRRTHVKGRVVLPNGLPVFAADVVVSASADAPFLPKDDPLARPRESRGTTDVNGLFDVPSDSGFVDISIRPHDGTSFPWVVLTNRVVPLNDGSNAGAPITLSLADVVIPEPSRYTQAAAGVLTDSVGNPIVHGVVRAYAFPPIAAGVDGGAQQTRGARLLGMTVTDDGASFQLFVVPPQ